MSVMMYLKIKASTKEKNIVAKKKKKSETEAGSLDSRSSGTQQVCEDVATVETWTTTNLDTSRAEVHTSVSSEKTATGT